MNKKLQKECPEYEDVSAFLDGELDPSSSEYAHIESCDKCRKRLEDYKTVNRSISDQLKDAVPDDYAANLITKIRERQEEQQKQSRTKPFPSHLFMKVAAILMISGGIFFIVKEKSPERFNPDTAEPLVFLEKNVPPGRISMLRFPPSRDNAVAGSDSIDINDLMNVSSGDLKGSNLFDIENHGDCVACIQSEVTQVWSVDNLIEAESLFSKFSEKTEFKEDGKGVASAQITISKKDLAELVRNCKTAGFRLLSPSQPQPEQTIFAGKQDDKVSYSVTLIQVD